jgi:hypothetical protein
MTRDPMHEDGKHGYLLYSQFPYGESQMMHQRAILRAISLALVLWIAPAWAGSGQSPLAERDRQQGDLWWLAQDGQAAGDIVLLGAAAESELVTNAADWIVGFVERSAHAQLPVRKGVPVAKGLHLVAIVGDPPRMGLPSLAAPGQPTPEVGPQGFVIQRFSTPEQGRLLVCWAPTTLGCRYGLIEVLRSLRTEGRSVGTDLVRAVDRPQFPLRICYVNFAEHLQNAFNPNLLFDTPVNRWSRTDWERFIDMISAYRYNIFEFWLVPTLFSPEALQGGKVQRNFAETINYVIAYAKRRGVAVHPIQAVNTVGSKWHFHCPNAPKERAEIVALWDHWSRAMKGNEYIGFFPGDPGGCTKNGCTAETYIDLCLELAKVVRQNNPNVKIEVGTWGEPFGGWGVPLWTGKPERTERSMRYFLGKLPAFPEETFTSINQGFSPDCDPISHGGDGRPYAKQAAKIVPVLTWDYSVTEGEGTVSPRCRVRRMLDQRRKEMELGCYSGGICYTMAPQLQCLSIFCSAESWWDPTRKPEAVLADFGRLTFGDGLASIGPLLEEFEVVPDWGYYPPFPYSPQRLEASMAKLQPLLEKIGPQAQPRLPLASTMADYRKSLAFFAGLFRKLSQVALIVDEMNAAARATGKVPADHKDLVSLDEVMEILAEPGDLPHRERLRETAMRLRQLDVQGLTKQYWETVYGIYGVIPHPVDPRAEGATTVLFSRFHCDLAIEHPYKASALEKPLRATGKPFVLLPVGRPRGIRGWKMTGWTASGNDNGEVWRASFEEPGILAQEAFQDQGYRWLVVRLTEGPKGGRKTIAVNGRVIGEFVRTGPAVEVKKEWWVTRCYAIPEGLLKNGPIEIRFTEPGIAIAAVALAAERIADSEQ